MKTTKYMRFVTAIIFVVSIAVFSSCRKNPTAPPTQSFTFGPSVTIQKLRHLSDSIQVSGQQVSIKFSNTNTILYGIVTADEVSGQLYKQVYVRDYSGTYAGTNHYGAICLRFQTSTYGTLYEGDSIAVNLNGVRLDMSSGGSLQLDSIFSPHFPYVKVLKSGLNPQPLLVTLPQLNTFTNVSGLTKPQFVYDAQLVQLNNVQFIQPNVNTTYAIPQSYSVNITSTPPQNINKYVCDANGNTMVAYNSGYANFASQIIPNNSGSMVAIANLYTTMQLNIRSFQDVNLTGAYTPIVYDQVTQNFSCGGLYNKTQVYTAGWQTFDLQGNLFWQGSSYGAFPNYGYAPSTSNYKTSTQKNDIWLVSPPIVNAFPSNGGLYSKKIDFSTAYTYGTNARLLSVWVSNTHDGIHMIPSQWTDVSSFFPYIPSGASLTLQPPNFHFMSSGPGHSSITTGGFSSSPIPITVGTGSGQYFYIAFRYRSNTNYADSTGSTYFLGSLVLQD